MKTEETYKEILNNPSAVKTNEIPLLEYDAFYNEVADSLKSDASHCVSYFGMVESDHLKLYCCIADDSSNSLKIYSHIADKRISFLRSITPVCPQLHNFEREIHENFGIEFEGHPWLKPVRYPADRSDKSQRIENYPFYQIESEELHEVGVGPIHAGIIEPGYFRFICNGEKVLHLEIQLGYQHRGIEKLFIEKNDPLKRCLLSESIAGDTSVGHGLAHAQLIESLAGIDPGETLAIERIIALEMERIAVHIGDTAALCADVAYQFGQAVCEALRTGIINTTQLWCGNRFGKGLIRPGGSNYPLSDDIAEKIMKITSETESRYKDLIDCINTLQSVLSRFDEIGVLTRQQAVSIGAVGMTARSTGLLRDIRKTHPFQFFKQHGLQPVVLDTGDVLARFMQRALEVEASVKIIHELIGIWGNKKINPKRPDYNYTLKPDSLVVSLTEGWRGEICHIALTDNKGRLKGYKIKDPSFHNWMALALVMRNQEISDFPVCNKSFNLSYCGNDL